MVIQSSKRYCVCSSESLHTTVRLRACSSDTAGMSILVIHNRHTVICTTHGERRLSDGIMFGKQIKWTDELT